MHFGKNEIPSKILISSQTKDEKIFTATMRLKTSGRVDLRSNIFKTNLFGSAMKPKVYIVPYSKGCATKIRMSTPFTGLPGH